MRLATPLTPRVVIETITQAVLGRLGRQREALWQPRLLDCARHYHARLARHAADRPLFSRTA